MKKILIALILLMIGCSKNQPINNIESLNGYWEIEKVVLADGTEKKYNFNQNIDFFKLKDSIGIRKKLQPRLDGSFITTAHTERFTIETNNNQVLLLYKNDINTWRETIISISTATMIIMNEEKNRYFYKRYKKLEL